MLFLRTVRLLLDFLQFSERALTPGIDAPKPKGLQSYLNLISQRAKIQGFIVSVDFILHLSATNAAAFHRMDYASEYADAIKELSQGIQSGAIKRKFHIVEGGIEQAPIALPMLFSGGNTGKLYATNRFLCCLLIFLHQGGPCFRRAQIGAVQAVTRIHNFCGSVNKNQTSVSTYIYMLWVYYGRNIYYTSACAAS